MNLTPFADDSASVSVGKLTIENGTDRLALYGSLDLTCDQRGLADARALKAVLDAAVHALESRSDLPKEIPPAKPARRVPNPFE